jgi:hypothetical protein
MKPHTHDDPLGIPAFLCRVCHPELTQTPDERAAADDADRKRKAAAIALHAKERELDTTKRKLASATKREHEPGSVGAKVAEGLRRKVKRLETELTILND